MDVNKVIIEAQQPVALRANVKEIEVPIERVVIDRDRNVRDTEDPERYDVSALKENIAQIGQVDAVTLEEADGNLYPVRGFLRSIAISELAAEGRINPTTGKPFSTIRAKVFKNLTEMERIELLLDHGVRRGLNKVELQRALERSFNAGMTEEQVITTNSALFEMHYPIPADKAKDPKEVFKHRKGTLQTAKIAWRLPKVAHDAYLNKLRGQQKYPTNKEMQELIKAHSKDIDEDKENKVSRENPGENFTKMWDDLVARYTSAAAEGTRPKSGAMANREQVETMHKQSESRLLKTAMDIILRNIPQEQFVPFDRLCRSIENSMTEDQIKALEAIVKTKGAKA